MDSKATKYMTSYRVEFNIYEVTFPRNVRLGDDIAAKTFVIEVETRGKLYIEFASWMCFTCPTCKPTCIGEQVFVEWIEGVILRKKMHCERCE